MADEVLSSTGLDALPPEDVARRAELVGVARVAMPFSRTFTLAVLAGAFISLGAVFATTVASGSDALPFGVARLLSGLAFSLGLILVVVAGAELFTGNNLVVMAWAGRRVTTLHLLRNWAIVYVGNLVGAAGTVGLVLAARQYELGDGEVGATAISIGVTKTSLGFGQAIALGILCNALVCLAVWLSYSARSTTDKIVAVIPPVTAFVAAGFEHSIANMYFVPYAIVVSGLDFADTIAGLPARTSLTWTDFLVGNLLPVTLGNVVGGGVLVGGVYWFAYLRGRDRPGPAS